MVRATPRPAQPVPGSGPPASTQSSPCRPRLMIVATESESGSWPMRSMTVESRPESISRIAESRLGSHPTCRTRFPAMA